MFSDEAKMMSVHVENVNNFQMFNLDLSVYFFKAPPLLDSNKFLLLCTLCVSNKSIRF